MVVKILLLSVALFLGSSTMLWAVGCGGGCASSAQCDGGCATCFVGTCQSCCDALANDAQECEDNFPGCTWNTTEGVCEDVPGAGCNNGIPEAPMDQFKWGWLVLAAGMVGLGVVLRKRLLRKAH
ncbi:hypothetical protein EBR78_03495 [bacterium]|nr:hypothetical protein [bacterium]